VGKAPDTLSSVIGGTNRHLMEIRNMAIASEDV
jgi:hypothetical protein